jgi:hypothetical protein
MSGGIKSISIFLSMMVIGGKYNRKNPIHVNNVFACHVPAVRSRLKDQGSAFASINQSINPVPEEVKEPAALRQ